jgi:hypothetical protein
LQTHVKDKYGPLHFYAEGERDTIQKLLRKTIGPAVKLVHENCRKSHQTYLADAPSPWHAFFYLRFLHEYVYRGGPPLLDSSSKEDSRWGDNLFFRGLRCASWENKSHLRRKDPIKQGIEQHAVAALVEYFRKYFVSNDDIARNTALCFAQHYGIATDLADITCDPDIAVWFATHPIGKACPNCEREGIVRAVSWASQGQSAKSVFLLPPPFVRNVYEQRGLFIDTSSTNGRLEGTVSLEVRFPRETAGREFQVLRQGRSLEVWPAPDAVECELVSWAREVGETCADEKAVRQMVEAQHSINALPKFWLERMFWNVDEIMEEWFLILRWVLPATATAKPIGETAMGHVNINYLKGRSLIRANPTFFKLLVKFAEARDFAGLEDVRKMVELARDELAI